MLSVGNQSITLTATGTPTSTGTDTFTITMVGSTGGTCNIDIDVLATAPPVLKNCQDLLVNGYTTSGIYTIDPDGAGGATPINCYCDQTSDGGGWTLVFNHDVIGGYWTNEAEADLFNILNPSLTTPKYSILAKIDDLQTTAGTYEFRLHYPDLGVTNHWSQTFDPRSGSSPTRPVAGYIPISINASGNFWGGLERSQSSLTLLDGSVNTGNWWYSIGCEYPYTGTGMPGPNSTVVQKVQLFIR